MYLQKELFKKSSPEDIFLLILKREDGREKHPVRENHRLVLFCRCPNWAQDLGMCPDLESNMQLFGVQEDAPTI